MTIIEKQQIKSYHLERLQKFGDKRSKILGWTTDDAQKVRFDVITSMVNFNGVSVLDLGCGDGDFKCFLDKQFLKVDYIGVDQQLEFIEYANQRFKDIPNTWFFHTDFEHCQLPNVDIVVACGSLSYRCSNPDYYIQRIHQFYNTANNTFIFNMLDEEGFESGSLLVSHNRDIIYKQCRKICKNVTLKTGYLDNDFTIKMQKL